MDPIGHIGEPDDIAYGVIGFGEAEFVTGGELIIDGGYATTDLGLA